VATAALAAGRRMRTSWMRRRDARSMRTSSPSIWKRSLPAYTMEVDRIEKQKRIHCFVKRMARTVLPAAILQRE
jgi:hypothetical protein